MALVSFTACQVTPEKIETWKGTQHGPAKLRAAVLDTGLTPGLRSRAALALVEIGLAGHLAQDLATLAAPDKEKLTDQLVRKLLEQMHGASEQATTKVQLQAKDALFGLRGVYSTATRAKVEAAIVAWVSGDWMARGGGEHSINKIVQVLGGVAARQLAERIGVDAKLVIAMAELIARHGTVADRERAATKLIALVKEQDPPQAATFEALGKVRSPRSRALLLTFALKGKGKYRLWALRALHYDPDPSSVAKLEAIAGAQKEAMELRGAAFEVLEKIAAPGSAEALGRILGNDSDWKVRYRAVEALCRCCKAKGVEKLLTALSSRFNYDKKDVIDLIEKDIKDLGKSALPALRAGLEAPSWIAKLVAVRLLGQMGTKADAAALKKLFDDRTRLKGKGWDSATLGSEAQAAARLLN